MLVSVEPLDEVELEQSLVSAVSWVEGSESQVKMGSGEYSWMVDGSVSK